MTVRENLIAARALQKAVNEAAKTGTDLVIDGDIVIGLPIKFPPNVRIILNGSIRRA